jgi:hypothetical protein
MTIEPSNSILSTISDHVFKLNFDYLIKYNTKEELQDLGRSLGEKNVRICPSGKKTNKEELCNMILNNNRYNWKTEKQINEFKKQQEDESRLLYYKNLKERFYKNVKENENEN